VSTGAGLLAPFEVSPLRSRDGLAMHSSCALSVWVSPDGRWVATLDPSRKPVIISLERGTAIAVPGVEGRMVPRGWDSDGSLWFEPEVYRPRAEIVRMDVHNGRVLERATLAPTVPTGVLWTGDLLLAPRGRAFVYTSRSETGSLFVLKGLGKRP
jgi:hypothetical protein